MDQVTVGQIVGMCTSFTVIGTFIGGIAVFCYKTFIKPNHETMSKHNQDMEEVHKEIDVVNEKLLSDFKRLQSIEGDIKIIKKGIYLLEQHTVFGNHVDKMRDHLEEFTDHMIEDK